jgi:Ca2+-binding RTX toxin-like protein
MAIRNGTAGADSLLGTMENDLILAGAGNDRIEGLPGDDVILAGTGNDTIFGDNFFGDGRSGGPLPPEYNSSGILPGRNFILAGAGDDLVGAGFGMDTVFGGDGNDSINGFGFFPGSPSGSIGVVGADGADLLFGGAGDDTINAGGGDDQVYGGADDDVINGGRGADQLHGGAGEDRLRGGEGADQLTGGAGADAFVLAVDFPFGGLETGVGPDARDVILDFCQGVDRIDLRGYANTYIQEQESVFLGEAEFGASRVLQVRSVVEDGRTIVQLAAVFGDPGPDIPPSTPSGPNGEIELAGVYNLTAADFILS